MFDWSATNMANATALVAGDASKPIAGQVRFELVTDRPTDSKRARNSAREDDSEEDRCPIHSGASPRKAGAESSGRCTS